VWGVMGTMLLVNSGDAWLKHRQGHSNYNLFYLKFYSNIRDEANLALRYHSVQNFLSSHLLPKNLKYLLLPISVWV